MTIEWQHDLRKALTETVDESGETQFVVNPEIIDYYLQTLSNLTRDHGVHIENDEDRTEIETKLKQLIGVMDIILETAESELDLIIRTAYAHGLSYQMTFPNAQENTIKLYKKALALDSNHKMANFLLGMFMFGTKEHHLDSEPYLETALELGVDSCRFTLGMIYLRKNEFEKGKEYITKFAQDNPDNQHAQLVLQALEKGDMNFQADG